MRRLGTVLVVVALTILAGPLAGRAQPRGQQFRIGYLGSSAPALERHLVEAFRRELRDLGYMEGQNLVIEYRWAEGHDDRLPALAVELVRLNPDVIVTTGTPGTLAAKQATKTVPIVMASSANPVESGLVASLAHPGGNVTGLSILAPELEGKRLQLLTEVIPRLSRLGVLWNPANDEFESAFATIARVRPQALVVIADRLLLAHRARIVSFAAAQRLPAMYPYREYVDAGGLLSYAPSNVGLFRETAIYVDKILKGAKPGDLPVEQPTKFELVINLKTAKALGLTIPQSLLLRADEVIQ